MHIFALLTGQIIRPALVCGHLVAAFACHAGTVDGGLLEIGRQYRLRQWKSEHGLPQNRVRCLLRRKRSKPGRDPLAVSAVSYAELAAGARTREAIDDDLKGCTRIELDFVSAWRAGNAFRRYRSRNPQEAVPPDFFIRAQAAVLNLPHLTNDRRRLVAWPDVDFLFPE